MDKRMVALDSVSQIGLTTLSKNVFITDEGCGGRRFKVWEIWSVFDYCERTDRDTDKWMVPLDLSHQIGLEIILNRILTTFGRCCSGEDVSCNILGGVF